MPDDRPIHERAVELAVSALDFELEPAERAWLASHLDGCPACRQAAQRYSLDARGMEQLPLVSAPDRVAARVLGDPRDRPRGPSGSLRLMALATAMLLVVAVGGLALLRAGGPEPGPGASTAASTSASIAASLAESAAASSAASTEPSSAPVAPAPSSSAAMPSPTPDPTRPQVATPLEWRSVEAPTDEVREIRSTFARDSRAIATLVAADGDPLLWWSDEGGRWRDAELPQGTFGGTAPWLLEPFANGFVALGWTDLDRSATERRIWLSPDGLAWRPDVDATGTLGPLTHGMLAASDEAVLVAGRSATGEVLAWRSTDRVAWQPLTVGDEIRREPLAGMASDGAAFFAWTDGDGSPAIWRSEDGAAWTALPTLPGIARLDGLAATSDGLLAYGSSVADGPANALLWSTDGLRWVPVETALDPAAAGGRIIHVAESPDSLLAVWRLADGGTSYAETSDGRSWTVRGTAGLPDGADLEHVDRVGSVIVALGRDADDRVAAFSATLGE